ncbi:hypothetical protein ABPG72_005496 [Tetrahymena utriculariae]
MNNSSQKKVDNYFEHPIYCSQIISNNACFHETKKLINQIEIYYDFPYSKQLFFVSNIDELSSEIVDSSEVQQFYQNASEITQQYFQNVKKANQVCWRKIKMDYFIEENGKKQYLREYKVIKKEKILEHVNKKKDQSQVGKNSTSESQNDETDSDNSEIDVLDGIYYFSDFLDKKQPDERNIDNRNSAEAKNSSGYKLAQYIEKIFDQFNKSVIYSFLSYFLSQSILILLNKKILIDIDISNLILIRENQNIKFVYLISFEQFKQKLENELMEKKEINYQQFCDQLYLEKRDQNKFKLNTTARDKIADFLQKISLALLNDHDLKEAKDDSEFAKQCISGCKNIEEAISQQDARKRYCKVLITKNQLLTALINSDKSTFQIFLDLYRQELENFNKIQSTTQRESLTQSEIINSFFQDYLKKAGSFLINQNDMNQDETFIEFICEEYPKQSNYISIMNNNTVQREKTKTPKFIDDTCPDHEIAAISSQKREMQLQLKIKEFKRGIEENKKRQELDILKKKQIKQISDQKKHIEEIKKIEQYFHSIPSIRGGEKKIMVDFKESTCSLQIKLYYQQELFALPENIDEMLYCIQLLNNSFNDISIYMDEHKRICFETHVCIGQKEKILLRAIYMIDSLITYGLTFYDFYYQSMINSKQSKDIQKYFQLQQEIQQYLQAYKLKYDDFVLNINKQF